MKNCLYIRSRRLIQTWNTSWKISKDSDNKINFFSDFTQLDYVKIISYDIGGKK